MKLVAETFRYMTSDEWRVLTAVELGMRNHEYTSVPLLDSLTRGKRRAALHGVLSSLLKSKLVAHENKKYDGYKLTYLGYDFLALKAFLARGSVTGVGMRIGVGKESDVHICQSARGETVVLKVHRLGRVSFRNVKQNRDYLGHRQSASNWLYFARLAAAKEFAYLQTLYDHGFPVPQPIDLNRHGIVMSYLGDKVLLSQIRHVERPYDLLEEIMSLIVRLARSGIIHGDFNEFNLLVSTDGSHSVSLIDFPQIVPVTHPNAAAYFDRDVQCIRNFFKSRFGICVSEYPTLAEALAPENGESSNDIAESIKESLTPELDPPLSELDSELCGA